MDVMLAGKLAVVCGCGNVGKGSAASPRSQGARVMEQYRWKSAPVTPSDRGVQVGGRQGDAERPKQPGKVDRPAIFRASGWRSDADDDWRAISKTCAALGRELLRGSRVTTGLPVTQLLRQATFSALPP